MQPYNAEELIRKYLAGTCTAEEKALVESWHLEELEKSTSFPTEEKIGQVHQRMQATLAQHLQVARPRPLLHKTWFRLAAAAILIAGLSTFVYLYLAAPIVTRPAEQLAGSSIKPGHQGAVLTLADGSHLVLDSLGNGLLTTQPGTKVLLHNGQLTYQVDNTTATTTTYNTITTEKGRQFRITLPDGSQVWLNAASSLRYPTAFTGKERRVYVTGEAYFEVSKQPLPGNPSARMPFYVAIMAANGQQQGEVQVLGTHFNINAYEEEEAIRTTLLEGSVRVNVKSETATVKPNTDEAKGVSPFTFDISRTLSPGQQAIMPPLSTQSDKSYKIQVQTVEVEQVLAWKNGLFNFQDAALGNIMRQLARWYDIEVVYEKGIPDIVFEGAINRQNELPDVLHSLQQMGVRYKLEGRTLTILSE